MNNILTKHVKIIGKDNTTIQGKALGVIEQSYLIVETSNNTVKSTCVLADLGNIKTLSYEVDLTLPNNTAVECWKEPVIKKESIKRSKGNKC